MTELQRSAAPPQLLVSVRNAQECIEAMRGGIEILDVKEPSRGPLGCADESTLEAIAQTVRRQDSEVILSAALGELREWTTRSPIRIPSEFQYLKLGLAGCGADDTWIHKWRELRHDWEIQNAQQFGWVAVIYADWETASAPEPRAIIQAASQTDCAAILIDTFRKDGRSLINVLLAKTLAEIAEAVSETGLPFAVAGSLRPHQLPDLVSLEPNIIGIRSAACELGDRQNAISSNAIRQFREAMQSTFKPHTSTSGQHRG